MESRAPRVAARAEEILAERNIVGTNPFFRALEAGEFPLEAFRATQEQFLHAVSFFPRPMAALVGRIPDAGARLEILRNLVEEHGEFDERRFHRTTFRGFLRSIGSDPERLDPQRELWPEIRAFNSVLTCACVLDELEVGVACMGIVEQAFAGISAAIGRAVVRHGWVRESDLVHYRLHAEIDERHAEEFYAVIEPLWDAPARHHFIDQGLQLGAYVFDRLYRDLHAAA